MRSLLAAAVQLDVMPAEQEGNCQRALEMVGWACRSGADLVILPELFLTGFDYSARPEESPYPSLQPFRELASRTGTMIIGSIMTASMRGRLNTGFCLDGLQLGCQDKVHPFGPEKSHFIGADRIEPILTSRGKIGLQICYDLRFPEVARRLCSSGADLLVTVGEFPAERIEHWRALSIARAIENQICHIACNWAAGGGSIIVDPLGRVLAEARPGQTVICARIDPDLQEQARAALTCWADRRPELY
ncbi:MAG: C-N hydrolase family amidase [Methanosaeta sp. PtaB.Bin039]|nr:MAG: C-N hydrolase family amidase [Methanosaeta sp. PtaB.Bin039]OPY44105.1 MAG: C-N hydrolase family amidase [Methanosaeta sp. PtaU1.Bin028]HOT06054.1 nitrilase-related carbon-nitrogen hydrolase [Methanotrichaceae archaeon]HQF16296.1 nitrilase-related carbon-nitrogen hydrolase [Methanotrichaceae archaeon]HQI90068.1 nitrilase-related carbon-nitrogen hydrolase [Methanotrichaceae archaeon]